MLAWFKRLGTARGFAGWIRRHQAIGQRPHLGDLIREAIGLAPRRLTLARSAGIRWAPPITNRLPNVAAKLRPVARPDPTRLTMTAPRPSAAAPPPDSLALEQVLATAATVGDSSLEAAPLEAAPLEAQAAEALAEALLETIVEPVGDEIAASDVGESIGEAPSVGSVESSPAQEPVEVTPATAQSTPVEGARAPEPAGTATEGARTAESPARKKAGGPRASGAARRPAVEPEIAAHDEPPGETGKAPEPASSVEAAASAASPGPSIEPPAGPRIEAAASVEAAGEPEADVRQAPTAASRETGRPLAQSPKAPESQAPTAEPVGDRASTPARQQLEPTGESSVRVPPHRVEADRRESTAAEASLEAAARPKPLGAELAKAELAKAELPKTELPKAELPRAELSTGEPAAPRATEPPNEPVAAIPVSSAAEGVTPAAAVARPDQQGPTPALKEKVEPGLTASESALPPAAPTPVEARPTEASDRPAAVGEPDRTAASVSQPADEADSMPEALEATSSPSPAPEAPGAPAWRPVEQRQARPPRASGRRPDGTRDSKRPAASKEPSPPNIEEILAQPDEVAAAPSEWLARLHRSLGIKSDVGDVTRPEPQVEPVSMANRELIKPIVGIDPASVEVHRGPAAAKAVSALRADAVAIGNKILMGEGHPESDPKTAGLLAHEMVHVARGRDPRFVPPVVAARHEARGGTRPFAPPVTGKPRSGSPLPPPRRAGAEDQEEGIALEVEAQATSVAKEARSAMPVRPGRVVSRAKPPFQAPAPGAAAPAGAEGERPWGSLPAPWEPMPDVFAGGESASGVTVVPTEPVGAAMPGPVAAAPVAAARLAQPERALPEVSSTAEGHGHQESGAGADLDSLAKQVYGILKRRLAGERRRAI